MALKKNDKIIAIAGVLILVIAAVSIVVLYSPESKVENTESQEKTFYVTWEEKSGDAITINSYVGKKATYADPITVTVSPADSIGVLTHVQIQLTWRDDRTYGLRHTKGLDILSAVVCPTGNEPGEPDVTVGEGNTSFEFGINSVPVLDQVMAADIDDANGKITENFSGKDTASFDTKITIKTGEKLRRPLKFLMDKGNAFDLTITYTYYYPVVTEEQGDLPMQPIEDQTTAHEAYMITNLIGRQ
jgi:hypothetical protein